MPEKFIARLQRIQNCLARVITKATRFSRSLPILKRIHKICAIIFRTLKDNQPAYLVTYLHNRNAQNIYAPQFQILFLFVV